MEKKALEVVEFYKQDIEILRELGHQLSVATKWSAINWSADVLYIWWWTYAFLPILIGKIFNKKTIITGTFNYCCPMMNRDFFRRNWFERFLIKFSAKYAGLNVLVSKHEYDAMLKDWKLKNLYYSPHCVDIKKYKPSNTRKKDLIFTICWIAEENLKRKCLPEIVQAAKLLVQNNFQLKFIIAGRKGNGFLNLKRMIEKNNLSDNFEVIGQISEEEKISYLQTCTIYLQPSKYEGFGLAIAEAMSCGAPVISSDVGEVREVVGEAGIILKGCSPEEIAGVIIDLLGNEYKREQLSKWAREKIVRDFPRIRRKKELEKILKY